MLPLSLDNVVAYCVQVAALTVAGTALVGLVRMRLPAARLAYWRALLVACVALPLMQPWVELRVVPAEAAVGVAETTLARTVGGGEAGWSLAIGWTRIVVSLWLAGAGIWVLRLVLGLFRLRVLRRVGEPAQLAPAVREVGELLGASADIRWVADLPQPVTFGVRRPVVLLPAMLRAMSVDVQRAVVAHELLHVIRRDWVWVVAEEVVRAGLWFHPAIWWLLAQMQLAREQVVDADAVHVLGERRPYMEALLACADRTSFAPVPGFARRRDLFQRLTQLSTEGDMSRPRVIASFTVMALGLVVAGRYTVAAFPLHEQPTTAKAVQGTAAPGPALRQVLRVEPQYPPHIKADEITGVVRLNITVDDTGNVIDAEMMSAKVGMADPTTDAGMTTDELTQEIGGAVRAAVLQWKYTPPEHPMATFIDVFVGNGASRVAGKLRATGNVEIVQRDGQRLSADEVDYWEDSGKMVGVRDKASVAGAERDAQMPKRVHYVAPEYPQEALAARVGGIVIVELALGADGVVTDARILKSIPLLDQAALDAVRQWRYEPRATPAMLTTTVNFVLPSRPASGVEGGVPGGVPGGVVGGAEGGVVAGVPGGVAGKIDSAEPVRVGGDIEAPKRIHNVDPIYPPEAQAARVQGVVIIDVTVGTNGKVTDARVLKSIPSLDEAALDAVKQWEFTPTVLNNVAVPAIVTVTVNFTLK